MEKNVLKKIFLIFIVAALAVLLLYGDIGIPAWRLKSDIRSSQAIPKDWIVDGSVSDSMAAYLSYPDGGGDCTFSVYVNEPGLSFGYLFRAGGSFPTHATTVIAFMQKECEERAFASMNRQKVAKVKIESMDFAEVREIDSRKPFVMVLPVGFDVYFYDVNGNLVEYSNYPI